MEQKIQEFLDFLVDVKKVSDNTVTSYKHDLSRMWEFFSTQGITGVDKVSTTNINSYILFLEKQGKSPASISRNVSSMRTYFHYLHNRGEVATEPTESVKTPKVEKKRPDIATTATITKLLKAPQGDSLKSVRDRAMLELLYATGVRVSEMVNLTVNDVNIQMCYIVCKTTKKDRIVPFGHKAKTALIKYLTEARPSLLHEENTYLFVNCFGKPMSRQGFWKIVKEYAKEVGIEDEISPHTFRHSFGAHLVENGADIKAVQEMMGHMDISSTQIYADLSGNKLREVYDRTHPRG